MNNTFGRSRWCLGLLLALALACGGGGSGSSTPPPLSFPSYPTIITQPVSQTVSVGQTATFSVIASGTPPLSYQWYYVINENGTPSLQAIPSAISASYTTPATIASDEGTGYEAIVENAAGGVSTVVVGLFVMPTFGAPTIYSFTANPTSINPGENTILNWSVTDATSLSIDQGVGTVAGMGVAVSPTATTTYTLTASNASGNTTATATVNVTPTSGAPTITSFTANPTSIASGQSSALSWSVSGATSLSINQGIGSVTGTSKSVSPTTTTTYTLTASNASGNTTATATVNVTPVGSPTITSFSASPTSISSGQSSTLSWSVSGGASLSIDQGVGTVTGTSKSVSPTATTTYTLTASNASGNTTATATVLVQTVLNFSLPTAVNLEVVSIPSGSFLMGAPADEENASSTEMPQHQVTISHSFYMAKFLTTQAQWVALMGTNPSHFSVANGGSSTDNFSRPVEGVSWNDITKSTSYYTSFMDALNAATTTTRPTGMIFRLPTEAEWEYSCRANTTTRFYWGDDPDYTLIAINAWYLPNSGSSTHPFGQMTENAFGLYDMSGNVSEWCEDWYGPYTAASETNPTGQATGNTRIARGGSWYSFTGVSCRSAYRYQFAPTSSYNDVGFRVVLAAPL